jgi:hypothetical protein
MVKKEGRTQKDVEDERKKTKRRRRREGNSDLGFQEQTVGSRMGKGKGFLIWDG